MNNNSLSIVFPVYNEQDVIEETIKSSIKFLSEQDTFQAYEIIAVNDGSIDKTAQILNDLVKQIKYMRIVSHSQNLGYGKTMASGIKAAQFSWVLLMDVDGQFKIRSLQDMMNYSEEYDIIAGYRHQRADTFYRKFLGKTYTFLVCRLFGLNLKDINCGFKLFKREALVLNGVNSHSGVFYTDIFIKAKQAGYRIKEVPIEHFPRVRGKQTGANVNVVFKSIMDLVKLIFIKR